VTWDYGCPFARNAHEHILTGLAAGADWGVPIVVPVTRTRRGYPTHVELSDVLPVVS